MTCGSIFDAGKLRQQFAEIEKQASDPNLWSNPEKSQQIMRERKRLESVLSLEGDLERRTGDIAAYFDLAGEGENVTADLQRELDALRDLVDRVETETLLSGANDGLNAIVTIHPGAGGTEAQDRAEMLLRMDLGGAERQGVKTESCGYRPAEAPRLKHPTFYAYVPYALPSFT